MLKGRRDLSVNSNDPLRKWIDKANESFVCNKWKEAFSLYKEVEAVAASGHVFYRLGNLYQDGHGVQKSKELASKYFKMALEYLQEDAQNGDPEAQCDLGYCYDNGFGVPEDKTKGVFWYKKSADQGYARAQNNVGCMYSAGDGVAEDKEMAVFYYKKAAEQNYAGAQHNLGYMYDHGMGVPEDKEQAIKYYKLAADQNYPRAQFNLGIMYSNGDGVTMDKSTALKYYQLAADAGYSGAQCNLGYLYHCGEGVPLNYDMAFKYYSLAAEQNDPGALFYLGYMYEHGQSVARNPRLTVRFYIEAKSKGDSNAKTFLTQILLGNQGDLHRHHLYDYLSSEWPQSWPMLHPKVQFSIFNWLAMKDHHFCSNQSLPIELSMEIGRWVLFVWVQLNLEKEDYEAELEKEKLDSENPEHDQLQQNGST